ncbi:unnamed protein product [Adineta steineri]|uniref:Uncharacterized protein n=1 Tax=Adineta steineri TaxID=433720 RepID=A0A813QYE0_9BILA|nr:unnamed protein product [Adineta steineri]CAF0801941.1 unnamed protein product [Adineta steineri]CAF0828175.1 unnamed protein product [Adineta steineri]CAF3596634.1 unnamed protein product [Adineta steineri]CAF3668549.1 unnamed protein product [Adineta steineri]
MAQQNTMSTKQQTQQSLTTKLQASLSQPEPKKQQETKSRRHLTLPTLSNNNYTQSPAEQYILHRSQMLNISNEQQDSSPETPLSFTGTNLSTAQSPMSHTERMDQWREKQTNDFRKKHKHQYVYGSPSSSSSNQTFSTSMYSTPSISSSSSQRNNSTSSISSTAAVKNDNKPKRFTAV